MGNLIRQEQGGCVEFKYNGAHLDELKECGVIPGVFELYYVELATDLRRGELPGLKWEDIDLGQGTIHVRRKTAV